MNESYHRFGDHVYRVCYVTQDQLESVQNLGETAIDTGTGIPEIFISQDIRGQVLLGISIHEALHACIPNVTEECVSSTADQIASFLYSHGWRKMNDETSLL